MLVSEMLVSISFTVYRSLELNAFLRLEVLRTYNNVNERVATFNVVGSG